MQKIMHITFEESENDVIFKITEFDPKFENVFKICYYQSDGKSYYKSFPKNTKNIELIKQHYLKNAEEMFNQLGYFRPIPWEDALYEFVKRMKGSQVEWWLTGSCATCIRGIPLNPHDVDITFNSKDIDELNEIFANYLIEPIVDTNGWLTKDFGVVFLHARIDLASDPVAALDEPEPVDCGPFARAHLETVTWRGYEIKVPPLYLQLNVNKKRGRHDRVHLIQRHMESINK